MVLFLSITIFNSFLGFLVSCNFLFFCYPLRLISEQARKLPASSGKGKKRGKATGGASQDFSIEYAKSSRATCKGCEEKIVKDEIRISKKDFESMEGRKYGGIDRWYHLDCFVKIRTDLEFFDQADSLPGIKALSKEDQATVKKGLPKISNGDAAPPAKKPKDEPEDAKEEEKLKEQNTKIFKMRDSLSLLNKKELVMILETNEQQVPEGVSTVCALIQRSLKKQSLGLPKDTGR